MQVNQKDVEFLKETAEQNKRKRIRLCTHKSINDSLHEMIITHAKDTYVRPHKHINKIESFHVIEGTVDVIVFDDDGNIIGKTSMGDYRSGKPFYHRISDSSYHALVITSDVLVFHEITNGPFRPEDAKYASWSPEDMETEKVKAFIEKLIRSPNVNDVRDNL